MSQERELLERAPSLGLVLFFSFLLLLFVVFFVLFLV